MYISVGTENNNTDFVTHKLSGSKELKEIILNRPYCLGLFKDNYRNINNFEKSYFIGIDVDEGLSLEDAKRIFADHKHIIGTTRSHQKDKVTKSGKVKPACDRFRIILFLTEPITDAETFYTTWFSLESKFEGLDPACKDPSRFWFPSVEIVSSKINEGKTVDPVHPVKTEATEDKPPVVLQPGEKGKLASKTYHFLMFGAEVGHRHHALYKAARDANQQGYSEDWFREQINYMVERTGDTDYLDSSSNSTIRDAFAKEPKHDPRVTPKSFNLQPISELYKDERKVDWLVDSLLSKGGLSILVADPKVGKSTLARQLMREVLRGSTFLDLKCKQGNVYYFAIEEQVQILNSSFRKLGITAEDQLFVHVGDTMSENSFEEFRNLIVEKKPSLVVVDTMFDLIQVESEFSYKEVKKELRKLRQVARDSDSHILLVHHSSKGRPEDRLRGNRAILGSQAIAGGVDTIIVIERDGKERLITTSGREVLNWNHRQLLWDKKTQTYSLGIERNSYDNF
jgi:hypothetical protein